MHAQHARDALQVVLDVVKANAARCRLQQDGTRTVGERDGRDENQERNPHADGGVGVETRRRRGTPDDGGGSDDAYVVEGVAQDMQENAHDAEIRSVGVRGERHMHVGCVRGRSIPALSVNVDAICVAVAVGVGMVMLV